MNCAATCGTIALPAPRSVPTRLGSLAARGKSAGSAGTPRHFPSWHQTHSSPAHGLHRPESSRCDAGCPGCSCPPCCLLCLIRRPRLVSAWPTPDAPAGLVGRSGCGTCPRCRRRPAPSPACPSSPGWRVSPRATPELPPCPASARSRSRSWAASAVTPGGTAMSRPDRSAALRWVSATKNNRCRRCGAPTLAAARSAAPTA